MKTLSPGGAFFDGIPRTQSVSETPPTPPDFLDIPEGEYMDVEDTKIKSIPIMSVSPLVCDVVIIIN